MTDISRRGLLGLVVSFSLAPSVFAADTGAKPALGSLKTAPMLDSWIQVPPTGPVTVITGKAELGQGLKTAILQVAAEQLDLPVNGITLVTADTARTADEGYTSGSHSMQDSATAVLHAAAQVRALLVEEAARQFGIDPGAVTTSGGAAHAPDGSSLAYGTLAAALSLHVEAQPTSTLKPPASYAIMGHPVQRVDIPAKVTGGAAYIQDMRLPGMVHARAIRQPSPGATLSAVDTAAVEAMPGVLGIVRDGDWLAVTAAKEWQAVTAWRALSATCTWAEADTFPDQDRLPEMLTALKPRDIEVLTWKAPAAPATRTLTARYTRPYQSHGSIGPSCAIALFQDGEMTVWSHAQGMFPLRSALAELLRLPLDKVRCIHVEGSGCYGHNGADDVAGDAALIARAMPGRPVRVQWMREDEFTAEPYGPAMVGDIAASLDADGTIVDWQYGVWSNTHTRRPAKGGLMLQNQALADRLPVPPPTPIPMPEGGGHRNSNPLYAFPNAHVVFHFLADTPVRASAMRALGAYLNIFAIESFMDELAHDAGVDPVAFRLRHMQDQRARDVISAAADAFGWHGNAPREPGEGRGFAFARYKNLGAYCAVAMQVRVDHETGRLRIVRVAAAVDSGQPINPDGIRNQVEGAIVQAASWTMYEQVRFSRRHITSRDWSGYPILRFPAVPERIDVVIMDRPGQPFLGTGEAGQGPTAAAIGNAIHDATGVRLRDLPLSAARVKAAIGV